MECMKSREAKVATAPLACHELKNERMELALLPEFGCHWTRLRLSVKGNWVDFLMPVPDQETLFERPTSFGSYLLAPWSNRVAKAAFEFGGQRYMLRGNFRDGTAIHGDVRTRPWQVHLSTKEKFEATLDSRQFKDFNYPFAVAFHHSLELSGDRLVVKLSVENVDDRRAPVGLGFHPFLKRELTARERGVIVRLPAEKVYPAEGCIPTGPAVPVSGATDLRELKFLGSPNLDHCFTGMTENVTRIIYPGSQVEVRFQVDPAFTHAVVYAPNEPDGRPKGFVAVEPVTHANDGFNLLARGFKDTGVKVLEPGERFSGTWEISVGDI